MGTVERGLSWIFAAIAVIFGAIALLRGFGIVGVEGITLPTTGTALPIDQAAVSGSFWDAMVWMFSAFAAGILAWTMSGSHHHARHMNHAVAHTATYIIGAIAIVFGALAVLVGFNLFMMGTTQVDGVLWGMAAVLAAFVTGTVHASIPAAVAVADEDYLVRLVESRVSARAGASPPAGQPAPGTEGPTP